MSLLPILIVKHVTVTVLAMNSIQLAQHRLQTKRSWVRVVVRQLSNSCKEFREVGSRRNESRKKKSLSNRREKEERFKGESKGRSIMKGTALKKKKKVFN